VTVEHLLIPLLALVAVVLQTTVISQIAVGGVGPDLVFLMVLFFALQRDTTLGLWTAFGLGLLQDIAGGGPLGLNAMILLCVAYAIGYVRRHFFKENVSAQVLMILIFTLFQQFLFFFWLNTLLGTSFRFQAWIGRALVMSAYHVILGPLLFRMLSRWIRGEDVYKHLVGSQGKSLPLIPLRPNRF
jgi:rod shape-determining protein MreD